MHPSLKEMNYLLLKWPQMCTAGVPVTVDQACEIIRRTDRALSGYFGGNDRVWEDVVRSKLGMPKRRDYNDSKDLTDAERSAHLQKEWATEDAWRETWKCVRTEYVFNSWIACSYIGGPHGWCHPDGQIGFVDNVGKWPTVEEIVNDWEILAAKFPFIDVGVTLKDGEWCEENINPVVCLQIRNGEVIGVDPNVTDVHEGHPQPTRGKFEGTDAISLIGGGWVFNHQRECGIPLEWLDIWREHAKTLGLKS